MPVYKFHMNSVLSNDFQLYRDNILVGVKYVSIH